MARTFQRSVMILVVLSLVLMSSSIVNGFFGNNNKSAKKSKKLSFLTVEEALAIYDKKYPFDRAPPEKNPWDELLSKGMPDRDLIVDDSSLQKKSRFSDIGKDRATSTYLELCTIYDEDRALDMVKAQPLCLAFDASIMATSFAIWEGKYGSTETKDMVRRNPGLLSVRPEDAENGDEQATMVFSYIIAATRPIGPLLLFTISFLLLSPAIEAVTGIPVRTTFLNTVQNLLSSPPSSTPPPL